MAIIKKTRECVEKKKSLSTISGKVNWFNNYGNQYTGSSKNLKWLYDLAVLLKYKSKQNESRMLKREMHSHFYFSTIRNNQDVGKRGSINEWLEKEDVVHICGILFSHEKEYCSIWDNMDGSWGHYAKWNKSDKKKKILSDVTCVWNLRNHN